MPIEARTNDGGGDVADAMASRRPPALVPSMLTWRHARFLAEAIPQQVWTAAPETGVVDFVNGRVVEYFGRPASELLGTGWLAGMHADDVPVRDAAWRHSLASGVDHEVNVRLQRHDGLWRWHLTRAVACREDGGAIIKWIGTNTDVDDATRAQHELQKQNTFEQQLIGIVSHDLRNPLNAIALSAAVLNDVSSLEPPQRAAVGRIVSSTNRAARLIRDLLDFSQARTTGMLPVHPEPTNLRDLVGHVVAELTLSWPDRRIIFEHVADEDVVVDPDRMAQVVDNLVGNALQHSVHGTAVTVRSGVSDDVAFVEVRNDGTIDVDDLPRLFEPFQQGSGVKSAAARSVGLGLSIAAALVRAHGGSITVSSTPTTQTSFEARFPRQC